MEQGLKERLVGATVLVVLAVVFVPMILDGPDAPPAAVPTTLAPVPSGQSTLRYDLDAPLPGSTPAAVPAKPTPTGDASVERSASVKPSPTSVAPDAPSPPKPTATPADKALAPTPGWAAQVGSFSKEATALSVVGDLKAKGFKAFVMPHRDGKQILYRVRIGPVATREAADALAKKVTTRTGQAARPVPHP